MMRLLRRFIFLLCISSSIAAYVNVGGDPIHRRNKVENHHASRSGEQSRQTQSTTRLHKRSKVAFVSTTRKKRVARSYENINTKRQLFPRRPILNTKRQLFPRGPVFNARRQLQPKQPVPTNIKRQLFPRKPLANTRRQLFPRVPLASSKRQLFSRTPLLGLKRQLFPRRPSPRKFPRRPDVATNQQLTSKRTFLNAKRQLFPRTPLLNTKTPLVSRRPIINKKRQLFPRRPLLNPKTLVVSRRPAIGSKRQLFPRIPLVRAQSRTLNTKAKYDVSQPSVSHTTTKTHVPIFHNNANSAELHDLHSLQHDEDRFSWKSYAEVKAPSIDILSDKKSSVIQRPTKPTAIVLRGQRKGAILPPPPPPRGRSRQNAANVRVRLSQRKSIAWSQNMQQNQKIQSQKSVVTPARRRFDPKVFHQHSSSEHAFPFAIHSRSELPKGTSQSIFPKSLVSLKGRTTIPGFHGDRIDSQRNARIAALEHYMDKVSKRSGPAKVVIHTSVPTNDHMGLLSVKKSYYKIPERKSEVSVPASKKYFNVNKRTFRYEHQAAKKRSTKEPNFESRYFEKPLSHEIHKLHLEDSEPVTTKRSKTHSSNKKQRFLIPKLIPTQITKNQIPNYNEPWKNHAKPSGGRAIDSVKVKKSLVKNATVTDMFPDVESIPSTTDSYYHPDTATTIHETTTITQMKSNLLDTDDDPFKGDAVAPSKKETVMTVQVNNDEDIGVVEDNATKKHFTGILNHNNNLSDKSLPGHKVRYRQLGISSDFMDMKTPTHNIVADDNDNHMKQNQDNDIVGKSRLNKYGKKTPDSQLKLNNINNRNNTYFTGETGKMMNNTKDSNDISKSVTTTPDNPVSTKIRGVVKQKTSASSDAHDIKTRVDSSEFKNSTGRDVKLVAPSQSNDNAKPFYMKEQASKDDNEDDDCTPEAQKKGECGNEFSKPPVVNNKNNQLGIAQSHATPAAGEMPPVKSKEAQALQAAQCACQGKVDCACEAPPTPAPAPSPCTCEHTAPDCACAVKPSPPPVAEVPETDTNHVTNECTQHPCVPIKPSHEEADVVSIVKPNNVSQVCSDEQDAACHHGKQTETESPSVTPPECATQTTPCVCAPNTPCACNPNCNAFSTASSGPPTSSPSETLALSTPVQKPCCITAEDCPSGQKVCEPTKETAGAAAPSARPSATNVAAGCSETCPHEHPTCVPCSIANANPSKGSAGWLPLSPKEPPSRFSSERPDNDVASDSLNAVSDNSDGGKVNMDAFVEDLPNVKGILASSFSKKKYNFRSCEFLATSNKNGVEVRLHPTPACSQISFSSLIQQLLGGEYDLAGPSDNLIVIGKFDAVGFNIDKIRERISFSLQCKELMDIIPNKLRISSAKVLLNFSYDSLPKSISDFVIKIDGLIHLNYRSRVLNINVDKAIDSTLFMIDMQARDLELPEFTKLFTQTEILQDELPSDLATLVTSSLRNPRISGLYDSGGAFEFVASSKSPPSIFPLQPMVYVIIQKPRLGKVVSGMIVNFERAMYKTLLSSILDKDLSSIPLFKDIRTDLAIGVSTDGLYVIKDALFNKEVGSLFDSGKPIKKGLTFKAKLPIGKMINDGLNNGTTSGKNSMGSGNDGVPENVLIDCEVTGNKMHLQFPEGLSLSLMNVGGFFGEEGQDMNFPTVSGELGRNVLSIKNYEVDNIEKKSVTVSFLADTPMKIGSLMTLGNVEANLKRDEYAKWSFVCTGDYQLGDTSVSVSLTSESDGFLISSKPSSIRSLLLVDVLDKSEEILKSELTMYHMDDFVIEDFRISGSLKSSNIIRFAGKPALFGVETSVIEFVATQEESGNDLLAMGLLFENVNLDKVFGRMLDRNLLRRSWAVGTNIGLFVSSSKTATDLRFEMGGLAKTRIQPGNHLRVLLLRPEPTACKGDSLCKVLSAEMPIGSAFLLDGYMVDGTLKLSETIKDPLVLSKSLVLKNVALKMRIKDSVEIYVTGGLTLPNVEQVGFTGELRVDNTGHLQLKMIGNDTWRRPFGLKNVGFFNTTLSAAFEPGFPVPTMDVHGDISIGTDPMDTIKSLLGPVNVKINSGPNGRNTFTAKVKDLNFERLAMATGSKRNLLRFQKEAVFLDDAVLTYGPINKNEVTKDATTRDTTPSEPVRDSKDDDEENSNEKSEIKLTGRMRVLGSLSDYTMKFLQDGTQLLAEVQMPDIGVNHGELTIKAGLKRHSVHSDPQSPKGPTLLIRMDPTMNSGIIVGRISALGFSRLSAIKVEDEGFSSMMFGQLPGNHSTNVTLHSAYEPTLEDANFQISACLPVQKPVKEALMNYLQDKAALTKKTLVAGEDRVQKTEDIFKKTSSNIKNYEDVSNLFLQEMRMKGDQLVKLKDELKRRCVPDCGDSCMGLPTWKPSGISLNGKDAIGAPSWSACSRKIPDLSCIVRCLGEKVIGNVRANRKQVELQGLISSLAETKNIIRTNRMYDSRARNLVNSTASGLNKIKNTIQVGSDIANFMTAKDNNIGINNVCFQDSLDNAERSLVNFEATTNINGVEKKMVIPSTLDGNTEYNIAEGIANTIFPGFFDFNKNLEQVKVLFSNLDGERDEIEKLMGKTNEMLEKSNVEVRSEVDWNPEEIEFRKLAFGELPRFTLSDDETMHAFDEQSLWNIAPQNDPLFTKLKEDTIKAENKTAFNAFAKEFASGTPCDQLKRSINHYGDVVGALTDFTKKFLQERNIFRRQKNHRLADLRMIDDQIKSDCFIENCTMEDMDNALSYLGKAKYGLLRWANVMENQIEEQNKVALSYFSKRAGDIVEASQGLSLRRYIVNVKSIATNAVKRTSIPGKDEVENDIKEIGKEMYHLLIGVKNSDELSTASPKIFRLKRQIQALDRSRGLCANVSDETQTSLDNLDEYPSKDGTDYTAKQQVVKENFMNPKFLSHKDIDDDIVSPVVKENDLDDDDDDGTKSDAVNAENNSNSSNEGEINYAIENNDNNNNEANTETKTAPAVPGEQRDLLAKSHEQHKTELHLKAPVVGKEELSMKNNTANASARSEMHIESAVSNSTSSDSLASQHHAKEDRMMSDFKMINDDVLSFNNDLRLDLPEKHNST